MKRALLLLASAALLFVGCAKEQVVTTAGDGEQVTVTFDANLSADGTKAADDGDGAAASVNRCIMEIYYGDALYARQIAKVENKVATFTAQVVSNRTYTVAFWADCVDDTTTDTGLAADKYYTTSSLKAIALKGDYVGNNDARDAFYASKSCKVEQAGTAFEAELKRPFAQMNVITTDWDKVASIDALKPEKVNVTVKNALVAFNAVTGVASGSQNLTYTADVYTPAAQVAVKTLSMDYLFASDTKALIDINWQALHGTDANVEHLFASVPYQRNYRTNIKGALLTTTGEWDVTVVSEWDGVKDINLDEVDNIEALNQALLTGSNDIQVNLPSDSDATKVTFTTVNDPQDVILAFNGSLGSQKTITFVNASGAAGPKSLTITAPAGTSLVFETLQNHVVINGASYELVQGAFSANTLVISKDVNVNTLKITAGGLEIHGTVDAIGEGLTDNVKVRECEGISNDVYNKLKNYIDAPYYKAVQNGDKWDIVAADKTAMIGETVYYNLKDALKAAQSGDEIKLLIDLENIDRTSIPAGVTFNGCGHKITGNSSLYINKDGDAIKNVVFKDIHNANNDMSAIYAESLAARAEISGCTFENIDWDAIQIPTESASADIVIKDNVFKAVEKATKQQRFVHIQTDGYLNVDLKAEITGNKFSGIYNLKNTAIELYCPTDFNKVNISGNYLDGNKISVCIANRDGSAWVNHIDSAKNWLDANGQPVAINAAIRADEDAENILLCTTLAVALQESASWEGSLCILTEAGLRELSTLVNGGTSFAGKKVSLVNDIDLKNVPFTPIGRMTDCSFQGTFDGCCHTISNLKIEATDKGAALFGYIQGNSNSPAMLSNLKLKDINIASVKNAAAFVAYDGNNVGTINNCHVDGGIIVSVPHTVAGGFDDGDKVGGIAGQLFGGHTISNCSVKNLTITAFRDLGGIIGHPNGKCYITNNTVENVTIYQSRKNAYGTYDTVDEIAGRQKEVSELINNTCTNVVIKQELADGLVYTKNEKLYEISKVAGLTHFRDMVTGGKDFAGETVKLLENLNLASIDNYLGTKGKFSGIFDGNGKNISNLKISGTANSTAFFGSVWAAKIKNLTITGANVTSTGYDYTGILAGNGYANIENCTVNGTVQGVEQAGAVIGYLSCGSIMNCKVNANVSGTSRVGILTGKANVDSEYQIEGNTIKGSATSNDIYAGGVVGQIMCATGNTWTIKNNSIDATVSEGGSLIGNVRNDAASYWNAFVAGYQANVTGNTWTAAGKCVITDGTNSVEISK